MTDLAGKTAFITGGAAGIGLAVAKELAGAGMKIVIADLRQDHLEEAKAHFNGTGQPAHFIQLDVTDRAGWAAAAEEAERAFGPVHLLYNNAGVNIIRDINDASPEDFDWVMSVNYGGMVNGVLTFLPRMKAHGEAAHIVNTSSIAGIEAGPGIGVYAGSKFAIRGFSEALRYDLIPYGIGVSVVCPGTVDTKLYESEEHRQEQFRGMPDSETAAVREKGGELFRQVLPMGMDPTILAERVRRGIEQDAFYIFTHPEVKQDVRESCQEMLESFTDDPVDPDLEKLEDTRRQRKRDVLKAGKTA